MRRPARSPQRGDEVAERRAWRRSCRPRWRGRSAEVHRHHAAGADVGVADLGIAHLPGGQAHVAPWVTSVAWGRSPSAGRRRGLGQRHALPEPRSGFSPQPSRPQPSRMHRAPGGTVSRKVSRPDAYGLPPEVTVSVGPGNPCRHCLRFVPEGRPMLILAHRPFPCSSPMPRPVPIFLCGDDCARHAGGRPAILDGTPEYLVKGYSADAPHRLRDRPDRADGRDRSLCRGGAGRPARGLHPRPLGAEQLLPVPHRPRASDAVIGAARQDRRGAVELFEQHHPRQHVGPDHRAEGQDEIRAVPDLAHKPVRPADHEGEIGRPLSRKAASRSARSVEGSIRPAFVERHHRRAVAARARARRPRPRGRCRAGLDLMFVERAHAERAGGRG
jgi:hypothetical protein